MVGLDRAAIPNYSELQVRGYRLRLQANKYTEANGLGSVDGGECVSGMMGNPMMGWDGWIGRTCGETAAFVL